MITKTYNIPVNSPFLSQLMPRLGAAVRMHGEQIGLSQQGIESGQKIDHHIVPQVKKLSIVIKQLELQIFDLSLSNPADPRMNELLKKLAGLKMELSEIQQQCIIQLFAELEPEDAEKLKTYFLNNKEIMTKYHGFMF